MNRSIACAIKACKMVLWILSLLGMPVKMQAHKDHNPGMCILEVQHVC
jgi:hypothetical protein